MIAWVQSILARVAVTLILALTIVASTLGSALRGRKRARRATLDSNGTAAGPVDVVMVGTFYNVGWFESHVMPLVASEAIRRVFVVCDAPLHSIDKVHYRTPGRLATRLLGRTLARFLTLVRVASTERPAMLLGYHIMPNALLCLIAASWCGCKAAYQMTGGPIQIIGGGVGSENTLLRRQLKPSRMRESLMQRVVRQFDWIIVRGQSAAEYVRSIGAGDRCLVVPGGVNTSRFSPNGRERAYDLIAVGRLVPVKRYDRMLAIIAELKKSWPQVRLAIVGDGPLGESLRHQAHSLGIADNVEFLGQREDVPHLLGQARVFILTSENEGLSIAMLEAMAAGLPAIVPDIGDLRDVVREGETGCFINPDSPRKAADRIAHLLSDAGEMQALSTAARSEAIQYADVRSVADQWTALIRAGGAAC